MVADAVVDGFEAVGEYGEEPGGGVTGAHFETVGASGTAANGLTVEACALTVEVDEGLTAGAALVVGAVNGLTVGVALAAVVGWATGCVTLAVGSTRGL
jgi:hypothetical protein